MRCAAAALLLVTAIGGCGTLASTAFPPYKEQPFQVYGGVRADLGAILPAPHPGQCGMGFNPLCLLLPFDLPLSLVADTVLLPVTVPYTLMHRNVPPVEEPPQPSFEETVRRIDAEAAQK